MHIIVKGIVCCEMTCKPSSLKCKRNKAAYKNTALSLGTVNNETLSKTTRSRNIYNPFVAERYGSNQKISEIFYDEQTTKLYVFKGFLNLSKENTTDYTMAIKDFWAGEERKVLVAYNSIKKRDITYHTLNFNGYIKIKYIRHWIN